MAPFQEAVDVKFITYDGDHKEYMGEIDPEWVVGAVPQGGYLLALIVEACLQYQANSNHHDPIHVTAHYLRTTSIANFKISVRTLKSGLGFTNITAELLQQGNIKIITHIVFGTNVDTSVEKPHLNLTSKSRYARRIPLHLHSSTAAQSQSRSRNRWGFRKYIKIVPDREILAKNNLDSPNRTDSSTVGGGGLEWGAWLEFSEKDDRITIPSLAFLADIFTSLPALLPPSERQGLGVSWFPTMVLSVEFKSPIPPPSEYYASRTVGMYSNGKFFNDGRHETYVEVWTAPSNFEEGDVKEDWRDKQVCLVVANQMAYTLPLEVNLAKREAAKL